MAANAATLFEGLRDGTRTVLTSTLETLCKARPETMAPWKSAPAILAVELEAAIHAGATATPGPPAGIRGRYTTSLRAVIAALGRQVGPFPDDLVAEIYGSGRATAADTVVTSRAPAAAEPDPREIYRRLFVRFLIRYEELTNNRPRVLELAQRIEASCFDATVRISRESEEPPPRRWESAAFVDIYSGRCGTIASLLDPDSTPCRTYGSIVPALLSGALAPGAIGSKTVAELCPAATAVEKAQIAARSAQIVVEKESKMFRCPHCGERRSTYRSVQRRSLDEEADFICLCKACNRSFKGKA